MAEVENLYFISTGQINFSIPQKENHKTTDLMIVYCVV
jgi:hypothetical protein